MFQPKPMQSKTVALALTAVLLLGGFAGAASAETPSPTPTAIGDPPGFTSPSPTATSTPISTPTPTPTPTANPIDVASSTLVVVNKVRPLNPINYVPKLDKSINLAVPAADGYRKLKAAVAKAKMGTLCLNSGYRSYKTQVNTYANALRLYGKKVAEALAAHPGHSEHQTGLAADVSTTALSCRIGNFGASKTSTWIAANAHLYGFIVRYPKNQQAITGYQYEPWHLRFVGVELATQMKIQKILTLEQFFKLPAAPNYKN